MINLTNDVFEDFTFPLNVTHKENQGEFQKHIHEYYEIFIVCSGTATHKTEQGEKKLSEGDIILIQPGAWHSFSDTNKLNIINIKFDAKPLASSYSIFFKENPRLKFFLEDKKAIYERYLNKKELRVILEKITEIESELKYKEDAYKFEIMTIFSRLASILYKGFTSFEQENNINAITPISDYIEELYNKPIKINDLSEKFNMTKGTLFRLFRVNLNSSPLQYQTELRIKRAKYLLKFSKKTIKEISEEIGFSDSNYFARQFKTITGTTASNYRKTKLML